MQACRQTEWPGESNNSWHSRVSPPGSNSVCERGLQGVGCMQTIHNVGYKVRISGTSQALALKVLDHLGSTSPSWVMQPPLPLPTTGWGKPQSTSLLYLPTLPGSRASEHSFLAHTPAGRSTEPLGARVVFSGITQGCITACRTEWDIPQETVPARGALEGHLFSLPLVLPYKPGVGCRHGREALGPGGAS